MRHVREGSVLDGLLHTVGLVRDGYIHLSELYRIFGERHPSHIRGELNRNTGRGLRWFKRSQRGSGKYRLSPEGYLALTS